DVAPTLTLVKTVVNDDGGNALPDDFGLTIGGDSATSGVAYSVAANTPIAIDEAGLTSYSFVSITGEGCPTDLGGTVTLSEGQNITCTITNDDIPLGILFISKSNDKWPNDQQVGNTVTYEIKVRAEDGSVDDVVVTDLLPEGFDYTSTIGSVSALSNKHGGITVTVLGYASPGTWYIGDMEKDEIITLTYTAKIGSGVDAGTYKDLAWAKGLDVRLCPVYAVGEDSDYVNGEFVGTRVNIVTEPEDVEVDVDVEEDEEEEVLGASTTRLPATGAATTIVYILLALGLIGGLLLVIGGLGRMLKAKGVIAIMLITLGLAVFGSERAYAATNVLIEDPETPVNDEFKIGFVTMDTESQVLEAKCYVRGPSDAVFSEFQTIGLPAGGSSADCDVNNSVLGFSGTYTFKVIVTGGSGGTVESNEVAVYFDEDAPGRPKYIEKDKDGSCTYEIEFKTADDGQTSYVEVYREFDRELNLNSSTRIRTISIGPDQEHEFDETLSGPDCDETPYYAVRAFDTAGNGSEPRAEEVVTTVTITIEDEGEEVIIGAIEVTGGGDILGVTGGEEGEEGEPGEGEEGEVLGEEGSIIVKASKSLLKSPWFWVVLACILLLIRRAAKKKQS
ncbi:hypothetical protein ACFLZ4_00005, partial [Patescibacteria group bacterium]